MSDLHVLEISGLPLKTAESSLRTWLEEQVGGDLFNEIKRISLMTDVEYQSRETSRRSGIKITASQEKAQALNCFIGFDNPNTLQQFQESLSGAKFEGNAIMSQRSGLTGSEIFV